MLDEPTARVSGRGLLLALCVTALVIPVVLFGGFGLGSSSESSESDAAAVAPPPAKGISLAATEVATPLADGEEPPPDEVTPTTRSVSPSSTAPAAEQSDDTDDLPPPPPPIDESRFEEGQAASADLIEGSCVHRTIAFETTIRVTNTATGVSTTCVVLARGPYVKGRIIELDRSVFAELSSATDEMITVRLEW